MRPATGSPVGWHDRNVRFGIVEGEPGIFPEPIARLLRRLARPFRTRAAKDEETEASREISADDARRDDESS